MVKLEIRCIRALILDRQSIYPNPMYTGIAAAKLRNQQDRDGSMREVCEPLPGSRTVPRTAYWPRERRSFTSHDAMKPPAPVTHTVFPAAAIAFGF